MRVTASGGGLSAYLEKVLAVSFSLFKATTQKSCNGIGELRLERENYALKYEFVRAAWYVFPPGPLPGWLKNSCINATHQWGHPFSLTRYTGRPFLEKAVLAFLEFFQRWAPRYVSKIFARCGGGFRE